MGQAAPDSIRAQRVGFRRCGAGRSQEGSPGELSSRENEWFTVIEAGSDSSKRPARGTMERSQQTGFLGGGGEAGERLGD